MGDDAPETPTPETPISYCLVGTPERDTPVKKNRSQERKIYHQQRKKKTIYR